jgi:hypothetical protein
MKDSCKQLNKLSLSVHCFINSNSPRTLKKIHDMHIICPRILAVLKKISECFLLNWRQGKLQDHTQLVHLLAGWQRKTEYSYKLQTLQAKV